jgi:hypothetical protein
MEVDASIETNSAVWQGILGSIPRSKDFSLSYIIQTGSGTYPEDIRRYYERRKAVEVWLTANNMDVKNTQIYTSTLPLYLHGDSTFNAV